MERSKWYISGVDNNYPDLVGAALPVNQKHVEIVKPSAWWLWEEKTVPKYNSDDEEEEEEKKERKKPINKSIPLIKITENILDYAHVDAKRVWEELGEFNIVQKTAKDLETRGITMVSGIKTILGKASAFEWKRKAAFMKAILKTANITVKADIFRILKLYMLAIG